MASFNKRMQTFRKNIEILGLKFYMWPYWFYYQNKRFKESYWPAFKRCKSKKNVLRIVYEIFFVTFYWIVLPYHYFRYGLYKREFSIKEILKYIPESVVYYRILPKINSNYFLLDNKNIFEIMLNGGNLPLPLTLLKIQNNVIFDSNNHIITSRTDFQKAIDRATTKKLFLKPSDCGSGGKEIIVYRKIGGKHFSKNKEELNFENISKISKIDYILQEGLENESFLN